MLNNPKNQGMVLWFTGLSGAGKTTIANKIAKILSEEGSKYELIDGDVLREQLNWDLGFDEDGRKKNVNIAGYTANLLSKHGVIVLVTLISPFKEQRDRIKMSINNFVEIYVNTPLEVCIQRDHKGLYKKALANEIPNFTGISHPYEAPLKPDVEIDTSIISIDDCVKKIINFLNEKIARLD
ncbi:MAG: adenylyl-sulfate kinase [Candidatus Komeilibacteria bacterium]|nr:adenylyl-sulfate kinase [Candidatus Komeilibacteria bacterium]